MCRSAVSERVRAELQVGGQVVRFLRDHLGHPIPSPALLGPDRQPVPVGTVKVVRGRARIPILQLKKPDRSRWDDRKLDHVRRTWRPPSASTGSAWSRSSPGRGVSVGVLCPQPRRPPGKVVSFEYFREERRVGTTTSTSSTASSGRGSSRSAPTPRTRRRCGSTDTSGPNARPPASGSSSLPCLTDSRPAISPSGSKRSATPSARSRPGVLRPLDHADPDPAHRRGSRRRLLVGAVDAPG